MIWRNDHQLFIPRDNSSDIFPARGKERRGCHVVNEESRIHNGYTVDNDDDDDDHVFGGYTKPILRRSREDIRKEVLESDEGEFDKDQGSYTRSTLDQPTTISDDDGTCELGCKTDEATSDPDGGNARSFLQTDKTKPLVADEIQSDDSGSSDYLCYATAKKHDIHILDSSDDSDSSRTDHY